MAGLLVHSPSKILAELIKTEGLGNDYKSTIWPVFINKNPDKPDNVIILKGEEPRDHGKTHPDGERQVHEGVQILVRSATYPTGYTKSNTIAITLDPITLYVLTIDNRTYRIQAISRASGVLELGKEPETNRELFSINLLISVRDIT